MPSGQNLEYETPVRGGKTFLKLPYLLTGDEGSKVVEKGVVFLVY